MVLAMMVGMVVGGALLAYFLEVRASALQGLTAADVTNQLAFALLVCLEWQSA
jgi:hypothetical protein